MHARRSLIQAVATSRAASALALAGNRAYISSSGSLFTPGLLSSCLKAKARNMNLNALGVFDIRQSAGSRHFHAGAFNTSGGRSSRFPLADGSRDRLVSAYNLRSSTLTFARHLSTSPPPLNSSNNNSDSKNNSDSNILSQLNKSNSSDASPKPSPDDPSADSSTKGKLKLMWKKYGFIFIGSYLVVYGSTLTSVFLLVDNDIITAQLFGFESNEACIKKGCDLVERYYGHWDLPKYIRENHWIGNAVIAWLMTKLTEPLRLGVALVITPKVANVIRPIIDRYRMRPPTP